MRMHYVEIPTSALATLGKLPARVVCQLNGRVRFQCAVMPLGGGRGFVSISQIRLSLAGAREGSRVDVAIIKDTSRYGLKTPPELKEVLGFDDEGSARFAALTPGRQRFVISYVNSVKNPDLRIERAFKIIENLKRAPAGKETPRHLLGLPPRAGP